MAEPRTTIESMSQAGRYVAELTPTFGVDEALRRVHSRASPAIGRGLESLRRYVAGDASEKPPGELAFFADFVKSVRESDRAGAGMRVVNESMRDARALAGDVRAGVPGDAAYPAALLAVATLISLLWLVYVAPRFEGLFGQLGATLPGFSRTLLDAPWLLFLAIAVLAGVLLGSVIGTRCTAAAIETMAPLASAWLRFASGSRVVCAHERWRVAAIASAWAQAGREPGRALRDAIEMMSVSPARLGVLASDLAIANEIGLAKHELDHQRASAFRDYRAALEYRRASTARVMQLAIAIVVGVIVVAIYLPIFRMGAVI